MKKNSKIYIAGHNGMVGSAILRILKKNNFTNIYFFNSKELNLINQVEVIKMFKKIKPEYVFICAAKVGGIKANDDYSAEFIYENIMIQSNLIHCSYMYNVKKLLFLGSSCIYPKVVEQPIKESYLLTGLLEKTNQSYAIAKISGIEMCRAYNKQYGCNYISVMPTNLYGPHDNYDPLNSHVFAALIKKISDAKNNNRKEITIWGSGEPRREFLHVDDLAKASIFLMEMDKQKFNSFIRPDLSHINVGTGNDISIEELVSIIRNISKYDGEIVFDDSKPDGTMKKVLDISTITSMGWSPEISLEDGLIDTYEWYKKNKDTAKKV